MNSQTSDKMKAALVDALQIETEKDPHTDLRGFVIGWNAAMTGHAAEESRRPREPLAIQVQPFMRWPEWFHQAVSDNRIITHGIGKLGDGPVFCEVGGVRVDEGGWIIWSGGSGLHPCPLPKVEQSADSEGAGYEAIEREHLGDSQKKTGIYAPKANMPVPAGWMVGDLYAPGDNPDQELWLATIHVGEHGDAIECHGATRAIAEGLRDRVMRAATGAPAVPDFLTRDQAPAQWTEDARAGYAWGWNARGAAMLAAGPAAPDGWREVIKRARGGLAAGERSRSGGDYELEFGGALIDGIEELLEGLAAAPEVPRG